MSDQPPILEYGTNQTPKVVSGSMRGPNLVIAFGLLLCWFGLRDRELTSLAAFILGGCAVLAGFKQHVIDVASRLQSSKPRA